MMTRRSLPIVSAMIGLVVWFNLGDAGAFTRKVLLAAGSFVVGQTTIVAAAAQNNFCLYIKSGVLGAQGCSLNITGYLTNAQLTAVQGGVNTTDVGGAIATMIAACPAAPNGCSLYFPRGYYYDASCNRTLSTAFTLRGDGDRSLDGTQFNSVIACGSTSTPLFAVNSLQYEFSDVALIQVGGTPTSGSSAIAVTSSNASQTGKITRVQVDGFYDSIDIQTGESWSMTQSLIQNSVHYGLRIRNIVNADSGDFFVGSGVSIFPANGAPAGISYESSGGGKIGPGVKILANTGTIANCINVNLGSTTSTQVKILGIDCEGISAEGIIITNSNWLGFEVSDNYIKTTSATAAAIALNGVSRAIIGPNVLVGNGGAAAITLLNVSNVCVGQQVQSGFTTYVSQSGSTGVVCNLPVTTEVHGQIYDVPCASVIALVTGPNSCFNAFYSITQNNMAFLIAGNTTYDGCIGRDASLDRYYLSSTSNDGSCNQTNALAWDGGTGKITYGAAVVSGGTVPTGTTGSCSASSFTGGALAGKFTAPSCVAGTIILSGLPAAPNGYTCNAQDQTTPANTLKQAANSTTSVTFTATTTNSDAVVFQCMGW